MLTSPKKPAKFDPPLYGSCLGLDIEEVTVLLDVFSSGYRLAKWTLNANRSIEGQVNRFQFLGAECEFIAFDAHAGLSIDQVKTVQQLAPALAWLEDPFPSEDLSKWISAAYEGREQIPLMVVGEDVFLPERLEELIRLPSVHALNLEVELLGITRSVGLLTKLRDLGRVCHLHGRAIIPSSHLWRAFPDVVRWVECHLAFASERLATVECAERATDPREIASHCLSQEGMGVMPRTDLSGKVTDIPI
ncbi:MAG TPA: enolase C-terminal domain-like protein [Pyrinomonadaceae bacterium]|nr:enolase C-terminal domain-like protein [Pyrinomonadaceae bacterium]